MTTSGPCWDGATAELPGGDGGLDGCGLGLDECGGGLERTWVVDGAGSVTGRDAWTAELPALLRTPVWAGVGAPDPPHPDAAATTTHAAATPPADPDAPPDTIADDPAHCVVREDPSGHGNGEPSRGSAPPAEAARTAA